MNDESLAEEHSHRDWQSFCSFRPQFGSVLAKWRKILLRLVLHTYPADADTVGGLIAQFAIASISDLDDVMTLTVKDKHIGAHRLLRVIYERVVVLKYIVENDGEADRFIGYDALNWTSVLEGIENTARITLNEPARTNLRNAASEARKKYRGEPCSTCGQRKQTSWTPHSSKVLAERTNLAHMHLHAFLMPSKLIHPTYWGIRDSFSQKSPMYNTMNYLHELVVHLVLLHRRYFAKDCSPTPMMRAAVEDFVGIWTFAETSFGGLLVAHVRANEKGGTDAASY